jgi:putative endopeptidase
MKLRNVIFAGIAAIAVGFAIYHKIGKPMNTGIKIENMDRSVHPNDDFYDFVTKGWRQANPLKPEYAIYWQLNALEDKNNERIKKLIADISANAKKYDGNERKIAALYDAAMDEEKLNADGTRPIEWDLSEIEKINSKSELPAALGRLHRFGTSALWVDGVTHNMKDSSAYIYVIAQGGIGLPMKEYYFDQDENSENIRQKYREFMKKYIENFGRNYNSSKIYALEEDLAKSFHAKEKLRDPELNYNKMTVAEFKKQFSGFDWDAYFAARGVNPSVIDVNQPEALKAAITIMQKRPLAEIKNYLAWNVMTDASGVLDDKTYELAFDFYNRTLMGQQEPKPRWKRAVSAVNTTLGEAIGIEYAKIYFPPEAKIRMIELVENLRSAYAARLHSIEWMSDTTKEKALEKLNAMSLKIGYPDKVIDFSTMNISENVSYYQNQKNATAFWDKFWTDKIEQPVDRTLWHINAHTVNAYYNPSENEICFPAGILQYPFFDMSVDDAYNYGAIGVVIGHEMTHGFDDQGRKFDKDGNMNDWWTKEDTEKFESKTKCMVDFFDKIEVQPGLYANGKFSLGENLADYGGVLISYDAYRTATAGQSLENYEGLTPDMRFFVAYATVWAANITTEEMIRRTKIGVHSLMRNRVNGILPHIDHWYDAFRVTSSDKMYIAPEERCNLW